MIKKLVQNPPPPGWAPELSTMIASATAKALAEEVVNAIPPTGVRGKKAPRQVRTRIAGERVLDMWVSVSFLEGLPAVKLPQVGEQVVKRRPSNGDTH